jgi:hypothetical protein
MDGIAVEDARHVKVPHLAAFGLAFRIRRLPALAHGQHGQLSIALFDGECRGADRIVREQCFAIIAKHGGQVGMRST